ncbi:unnamed protein product [Danaus chrysippus]|uniref:(African queen) hypothetical protein n=1 Tax=Danaus chrysippus TaxID=151541 RepID=A0A8J2VVC4_9NEOP|nr:unnamed protein product [Danaus chrysippus]
MYFVCNNEKPGRNQDTIHPVAHSLTDWALTHSQYILCHTLAVGRDPVTTTPNVPTSRTKKTPNNQRVPIHLTSDKFSVNNTVQDDIRVKRIKFYNHNLTLGELSVDRVNRDYVLYVVVLRCTRYIGRSPLYSQAFLGIHLSPVLTSRSAHLTPEIGNQIGSADSPSQYTIAFYASECAPPTRTHYTLKAQNELIRYRRELILHRQRTDRAVRSKTAASRSGKGKTNCVTARSGRYYEPGDEEPLVEGRLRTGGPALTI